MFKSGSWNASVEDRLGNVGDLLTRVSTAEIALLDHDGRISDIEEWFSSKSSAIPNETNMTVSTSISTAVITLGLQAPLASSIETNINSVKTEVNAVKSKVNTILSALRVRGIIIA